VIGITPGFEPLAVSLCVSLAESGPVAVAEFDDAWTPAGETYRDELVTGGLIRVEPGGEEGSDLIVLTAAGVALAQVEAPDARGDAPQP
jgi:hypothetical protein